ncbi:MAG TPA: NAD(P)/FAD-dependent oxidoreductase, partial [Tepidisphaeraceae bacterium]|nr:NAD(P)/FAD-dependent oxidoreductase [Tepidisphaeraceae bacterium]
TPKRIIILGSGFGGTYTAHHLQRLTKHRNDIEITLVSRDNYFLMTPLLFEAGSGVLEPRHAVNPLRPLLKRVRFVKGVVTGIDLDKRVVNASPAEGESYALPYDELVIALGGITNTTIVPGSDKAMRFKHLADAILLRNHVIELFEQADVEMDPARKRALLTFVVVGAGLVGVELMGELDEFLDNLVRSYPRINQDEIHLELIEAGPAILPELEPELGQYAADVYTKRGINVRVKTPVERIEPTRVYLPGGMTIDSHTIVAATGVAPNPLLKDVPLAKDRKGRIITEPTMRVKDRPEVWALGDSASIPDPDGKPYPPLAQHAIREARVLAGNILAAMENRPLEPFVYKSLGTLASLGHYKGVGRVLKFHVKGFLAWWIWRSYYLFQMPRWNRRLRVMVDWTVALLFKNDVVKLELFGISRESELAEETRK